SACLLQLRSRLARTPPGPAERFPLSYDRAAASTAAAHLATFCGGVMSSDTNRRKFLGSAAGAAAFTILPRHVLARSGEVPPSDKINLAYIGTGTQGLRELLPMLASPEIQVVSVCDPCKNPSGYRDWSRDGLLKDIRRG